MDLTIQEIDDHQGRGDIAGLGSGFPELDRLTTGFRPGQMIVVAARPGVGKSTLGLDFCRAASIKQGVPSAIFSLEMTGAEIAMRLLSAEAKVAIHHMRGGGMTDQEWTSVSAVMPRVQGAPIIIDDSPNMTMPEIRSKARRIKKKSDLGLLVIDYLQLMTSGKRVENRQVEVSEFSRQIKLLAKELEIPVVAISQLNRGSEQRTDKTPQLSDLRESGSIEQDADIVMLLNRPDAHGHGESDRPGEADIIVAKNRSGPVNRVAVSFQGHYSRFTSMARSAEPPGRRRGRILLRSVMSINITGRRLLLALAALIAANVVCVFLAVDSGITERGQVWGFDIIGFIPLPMVVAELVLAWLAARNVRPPIGRISAVLLSVICLISVLAGLFDGDMRNESMTSGSFWWGVVLIVLQAVVGLLAVIRARELRRGR